jgi:hypothetical protein
MDACSPFGFPHRRPRRTRAFLQLFQGAVLAYLFTGDPGPGRRALVRIVSR